MALSDDLGKLVLELAEHNIRDYEPQDSRQKEIEQYFCTLDNLLKQVNNRERFAQELSLLTKNALNSSSISREGEYEGMIQLRAIAITACGATFLISACGGISANISQSSGNAVLGLLSTSALSIALGGYFAIRAIRRNRAYEQFQRRRSQSYAAATDDWMNTFAQYRNAIHKKVERFHSHAAEYDLHNL